MTWLAPIAAPATVDTSWQLFVAAAEASEVSNTAPLADWSSGTATPAVVIAVAARWRSASAASPRVSVEDAVPVDQFSCDRSEEHTSELQSLMRISYAVFCLKKKINNQ